MKRLWFVIVSLLISAGVAFAQQSAYIYTPLGYQQLSVTSASAVNLTVPNASRIAEICLEANQVRYRDDGTAPTTSAGMPVTASQTPCFQYSGNLVTIQFIAVITASTLDISYYR